MSPHQRQPSEAFDFDSEYGARYEKLAHQLIPGYAQLFPTIVALLDGRVADDARVLVVGCGTGIEMATLGKAMPNWQLTGVDPSSQMLELAREKLASEGLASRYELHHGYAEDLPLDPAFDAATLINVLHFLPDDGAKLALLQSVAVRLRPGALFVLFDLHGDPSSMEFEILLNAWKAFMLIRGMSQEERSVFVRRLDEGMHYVPESRILDLLAEAGFKDVTRFCSAFLYGGWVVGR